jgi:predicted phage terminase large subunit-like protein
MTPDDLQAKLSELVRNWEYLKADERQEAAELMELIAPTFASFCQATLKYQLDPWQIWLCNRLEKLRYQKGQRILLHAPPQVGKSVIVAQRLPAYLMGCNPVSRNAIGSYNQQKAIDFSKVVQSLMRGGEFMRMFPSPDLQLAPDAKQDSFSTMARYNYGDGQSSLVALGMATGYVGKGFDGLLVIDDPYPSALMAGSPVINTQIRQWWEQTVMTRVPDETNIIVCFHRYHSEDFAQYLIDQGGWEFIRLAAIADESDEFPDPLGRQPGELLTPRLPLVRLQEREERDSMSYHGQFQGLPRPLKGGFFEPGWFEESADYSPYIADLPPIDYWVRAWDTATGTKAANDWSVGALMGVKADGTLILADIKRVKKEWADLHEYIKQIALEDKEWLGRVRVAIEHKAIGIIQYSALQSDSFWREHAIPLEKLEIPQGEDKKTRANYWNAQLRNGYFKMLRSTWNQVFISECLAFTGRKGGKDDQVDAVSNAVQLLSRVKGGAKERPPAPEPGSHAYYAWLRKQFNKQGY